MEKFKIGDSVRLKTDRSETMVITGYKMIHPPPVWKNGNIVSEEPPYPDKSQLICSWHDREGKPHSHIYPEDSLEVV